VEIYLWSGAGLLALALAASFRMQVLQHQKIARLGDRVVNLTSGIALLTDTVEGGLRDVAQEIERLSGANKPAAKPKARAVTQRRVSAAAKRGRSEGKDVRERSASASANGRRRRDGSGESSCLGALTRAAAAGGPTSHRSDDWLVHRSSRWAHCSSTSAGTARARVLSRPLAPGWIRTGHERVSRTGCHR